MSESIFTLYNDDKFEKIRYYLQEHGYITLNDIAHFDFDELMFVPGVSEHLISEAKRIFFLCSVSPSVTEKTLFSESGVCEEITELSECKEQEETDNGDAENDESGKAKDVLIDDVYSNVPRSGPFILKCAAEGKYYMSQLTDEDFESAVNLRGIGVTTIENLRRIYLEFVNSSSDCLRNTKNREYKYSLDLISNLPLSTRAKNALMQAGILSIDELLSLTPEDLLNFRNIGTKTCQEILDYQETVALTEKNASKRYLIENIASENRPIPIPMLRVIGLPSKGIDLFLRNSCFTVSDLCDKELTLHEHLFARTVSSFLFIPVTQHFSNAVNALNYNEKISLERRSCGATLEEIGEELGISRERVRQILKKTYRKLIRIARLIAGVLFSTDKDTFSFADIVKLFSSEKLAMCCKLVLQESKYVYYFRFSDSFIKTSVCGDDIMERLEKFTKVVIGEGLNFYDNLELIESELKKYKLNIFDITDIMDYLVHNGYRFYGDYVTKGNQSYAVICHDAIRKYFRFDIKLDSDLYNEDIRMLRQIMSKHYRGVRLPENNRALTAGMTRDTSKLILSGRGRYCPIEKVIYNMSLFEEIYYFIINSPHTSFYYGEIYSRFKGRFQAETNIDNPYFLHGMLKYLYPNEFIYKRDLLYKHGELRQSIYERMSQLLQENGRSMTKEEIKQAIPGIRDSIFMFSSARMPEIIQWDYNEYNHINNVRITTGEKATLHHALKTQLELHNGYCSDVLLFNAAQNTCREFLSRNNINNPLNLYYVASYLFDKDYRFRRPHIISKDFPVQDITTEKIAQILFHCETHINYEEFFRLATTLGWASATAFAIFSDLEKDFIRVSQNDYVRKNCFDISKSFVDSVSKQLQELVSESGYFAINGIFDYKLFPQCPYEWNGFLLESIIKEYDTGFRIIYPQIKDRRYQRGIIVPDNSSLDTFVDLVIETLLSDGIIKISENELLKYLKMHGLISTNTIPQELYKCSKMQFKNDLFFLKK